VLRREDAITTGDKLVVAQDRIVDSVQLRTVW
jgi:hypothetical protein